MRLSVIFVGAAAWMWYVIVTGVIEVREAGGIFGNNEAASAGESRRGVASAATVTATATPAAIVPSATATHTPAPEPAAPEPATIAERFHTVERGDTMYLIAQRYGITLGELLTANPGIANPARIEVGDRILLPAP
jgi:LysM repeat protein